MKGETDLQKLLKDMQPKRNEGEYVFCLVKSFQRAAALDPFCIFREDEGVTVILTKAQADVASLPYTVVCAWITLTVHSSLEAVGLTAAVSKALTEADISCNVVAAYYHDHIFVPVKDAGKAMSVLEKLSKEGKVK
ncbi:MAG: hypothetical protein C3F07_04770 [Anaerolineales bacterium]|nr:ACT domain-containing protein [Anaerolineae bacterium]PWB75651.1 MAG: hypothetical protein C3F07_04770 [Anaerolineales bacterium]